MQSLWGREPVLIMAAVQAALAMLVSFGIDLTGDQVAGIMGFAAAVVGLIVRQRVSPVVSPGAGSRSGALGALLLAAALGLGVTGCATLETAPNAAAQTEAERAAELAELADVSRRVVLVVEQAQLLEIELHDAGVVPDDVHATIQDAFREFGLAAIEALDIAEDLARPEADRRDAVRALIDAGSATVARLRPLLPPGSSEALQTTLSAVQAALVALNLAV